MAPILPFTIAVPQAKLDRLKIKLSLTDFPDELENAGWDFGAPLASIKSLVEVWKDWDWRDAEARLNTLPQFHTDIEVAGFDVLDIHFVHARSKVGNAIPLLFIHGWPGSFNEMAKLLPLLSAHSASEPAFHIVAPSLPNFGFSQGVTKRNFALAQYAETCHKLMARLGYTEYVTQGGDWGFYITRAIAGLYPNSCKATHINTIRAQKPTWSQNPLATLVHTFTPYSSQEKRNVERRTWFEQEGRGYLTLQATKSQTLSYALDDSPVALLAWIYEKLHDWTDAYPWTHSEILEWVSIYYFSRAGAGRAHQIYYEVTHAPKSRFSHPDVLFGQADAGKYIGNGVKLGLMYNPMELNVPPKAWCRTLGDVVYESENPKGGHFIAYEIPEAVVKDLQCMFGKGGGAFEVVSGRTGYD